MQRGKTCQQIHASEGMKVKWRAGKHACESKESNE